MLDRLRQIAEQLDDAEPPAAATLVSEAASLTQAEIVRHEWIDEKEVYPRFSGGRTEHHALLAMSRAHREILHLARLLERTSAALTADGSDRTLQQDSQRIISAIEVLVRLHSAQEDDIYRVASETAV